MSLPTFRRSPEAEPIPPYFFYTCDPTDDFDGHAQVLRLHNSNGFYGTLFADTITVAASCEESRVLGYATANLVYDRIHERRAVHINELCVDRPFRGQRELGPALLRATIEQPVYEGVEYVQLDPTRRARSFYDRLGFAPDMRDVFVAHVPELLSAIPPTTQAIE